MTNFHAASPILRVRDLDAAALHREVSAAGGDVRMPPSNFPWALEFHLRDPDGNVLRLGSEPLAGRPWDAWTGWYKNARA